MAQEWVGEPAMMKTLKVEREVFIDSGELDDVGADAVRSPYRLAKIDCGAYINVEALRKIREKLGFLLRS